VGKTTLLKEFRRIAEELGHVVAYVNEGVATNRVDDVPEAMHRLAEDLEQQGYKFDKFREQYKAYRVKKQEMEADPEAPKDMVGGVARGMTKMALDLGKSSIPVVGGMIDTDGVATKVGELASYGWERFRNKDEERLIKETLEVLTPLFLEGMKRIPSEKALVLMLDTYEVTGTFLDGWMRALLEEEFGEIKERLLVCIAGRQPIDRNAWADWETLIARSPLEPFTEAETRQFLASRGIHNEAIITEIWRLSSGGLPLLVAMMAANAPTTADAVVDCCELAVERFLKWEPDVGRRQLAQDGALPRVLNEDVVAVLGDGQFEWLKGCPFVLREGDRWRYHLVVREQMMRYHLQRSRKRWVEVHSKLAAYYDEMRTGLQLESKQAAEDEQWREWSLEWFYHKLCAEQQAGLSIALNGFLTALKASREFALEWATAMAQAGEAAQCEPIQCWGNRLRVGMVARNEKRYEAAISVLTALLAELTITENLRAVALDWRGCWYRWSEHAELGLQDLQQAVAIDGEDAEYWVDLADAYNGLKRYEEAITAYQKAIELDPKDAYPHNRLGDVYQNQEHYEKAILAYKRAIELDPNIDYFYNDLANVYRKQKQYEEAITVYQKAIKLNPKFATVHNKLGILYQEQKRYEEAIAAYQKASELDPKDAYPHNRLGDVYQNQEHYEKAILAYKRAVELDPNIDYFYNDLANVYRKQKQYEEAITVYQKAIKLNPKFATVHNKLGILYQEQKRYEEAIAAYKKAIELNPKDAYTHSNLGNVYQEQKQFDLAIESFQKTLSLPDSFGTPTTAHTLAHNGLGNVYKAQQRYEDAITAYEKAIELDPKDATPHCNLGILYQEQQRYEDAIAHFNQALEIDPSYVSAQESLGYFQYKLENYDASLQAFQAALNLQPDSSVFASNLGYLYLLQGCIEEAQERLTEVINDKPFDRAWLNLGLIQAQQGQIEKAKQFWQQGLHLMEKDEDTDDDWNNATRYVFTVAIGKPAEGLEQMQRLIDFGADEFVLRNALNDATILSRSSQPIEGVEQMIAILREALSKPKPLHTQA
jgi:tetratricopeptide (TPR) repeat protein